MNMSTWELIFLGAVWGLFLVACLVKWLFEIKIGKRL